MTADEVSTLRGGQTGSSLLTVVKALTVDIQPVLHLNALSGYEPGTWACRSGLAPKPITTFAIPGTLWTGVRVQVGANEAVSCVQTVSRTP